VLDASFAVFGRALLYEKHVNVNFEAIRAFRRHPIVNSCLSLTVAERKAQEVIPQWLWVTHNPVKLSPCAAGWDYCYVIVYAKNCRHHAASLFSEMAFV
jgi:hypothetical protein